MELQAAEQFFTENYPKLTDEQRIIFDEIKPKAGEISGGFYLSMHSVVQEKRLHVMSLLTAYGKMEILLLSLLHQV